MRITLIGMSGAGKTYWSKKLEEKGFKRFCCDDLIEGKLGRELQSYGFRGGIKDVAKWMGQPFDEQYNQTNKKYLAFEEQVLENVLNTVEKNFYEDIVIDTTGSIVYLSNKALKRLSALTKIIYLDLSNEIKKQMYQQYIKDPKPVIWGKSFYRRNGETNLEALQRCYPELLKYRSNLYENLADMILGYHENLELHFL